MSDVWRPAGGSPAPEQARPPSLDDLLRQVSRGDEAAFERLYDQLAAPDAETIVRPVNGGGSATIVRSRSAGRLVFTASGLPNLPASRAYELWLMGPDGPRPAGLLQRAADGTVPPLVALTLDGEEQLGLTVEPAGGSARPTTQPILLTRLPGA